MIQLEHTHFQHPLLGPWNENIFQKLLLEGLGCVFNYVYIYIYVNIYIYIHTYICLKKHVQCIHIYIYLIYTWNIHHAESLESNDVVKVCSTSAAKAFPGTPSSAISLLSSCYATLLLFYKFAGIQTCPTCDLDKLKNFMRSNRESL